MPPEMQAEDASRLVHELQVHQTELELQNQELRNALEQLEESRTKYSDLYDFAPVGYLTVDRHGEMSEANLTAERQFGEGDGPGGWIVLFEPELRLGEHTIVPDLAGWKKERLPEPSEENWIAVSPDWICEVLSPSRPYRTSGSLTHWPRHWTYSGSNPANVSCRQASLKMTK